MGKQDLLLDLIREMAIENPEWKVSIPLIFQMAQKNNIYTTQQHFKQAVKALQASGMVEISGSDLFIPPGRLMM